MASKVLSPQAELPRPAATRRAGDEAADQKSVAWNTLVPSREALRGLKIEALFREAAVSFHRNGYTGTSLSDIAAKLGVSKAGLYYYIDTKQALLLGCHMAASDAADAVLAQVPKAGLNGLEKLHMALRLHLESIMSETSSSVLALEESALTPENFRAVAQRRDHFQAGFVNFIREGVADGSIVDCDPKLAAFTVLGGVNWAEKWYRPGGLWSAQQIARAMADMLVRSVAAVATPPLLARVTDYPDGVNAISQPLPIPDPKPRTRAASARAVPSPRKKAGDKKTGSKT